MVRLSPLQVLGLALASAQSTLAAIDTTQAPPNLTQVEGTQLYWTWRPRSHIVPLYSKMEDPCMHYTDPSTGSFHVGHLWMPAPDGATACKTDDLVTYHDVNEGAGHTISPGGKNDPLGVFDGSVIPSGVEGYPTLIYSGVKHLPITWSMRYTNQSETQSLAVTRDGGEHFEKLDIPPVLVQPASETEPTAFRDPYAFKSYQLDALLGVDDGDTWYVTVSGGVKGTNLSAPGWTADAGPAEFLYRQAQAGDYQDWEYLGTWWKEHANSSFSDNKWGVDWGFNQETSNLCNIDERGANNVDGDMFITHGSEYTDTWAGVVKDVPTWGGAYHRDQNWSGGRISLGNATGRPEFEPTMSSRLDWGRAAYAAAGQVLTAESRASTATGVGHDRWVVYVWLSGDYFDTDGLYPPPAQNWTGALSHPRELTVGYIDDVVDNGLAREVPGAWVIDGEDRGAGTVRLKTLRQVVARETLAAMTDPASTRAMTEPGRTVSSPGLTPFAESPSSRYFVLGANLTFPSSARGSGLKAGFEILAGEHERTTLWYQFSNESFLLDRSESSAAAASTGSCFDLRPESGLLRLFDLQQGGSEVMETLQLTLTFDNSFLEVHANDRFAMSAWVNPWYDNSTNISFFVDGEGNVTYSDVTVHEGLFNAFPDRNYEALQTCNNSSPTCEFSGK